MYVHTYTHMLVHTFKSFRVFNGNLELLLQLVVAPIGRKINTVEAK